MSARKKDRPYRELGAKLEAWRTERFRSCLALFNEHKFGFSYDTYVDFEKGKSLPSVQHLSELSDFFKKDLNLGLLLWAKVQMPHEGLNQFFQTEIHRIEKATLKPKERHPKGGLTTPSASFETTWVFGLPEKALLLVRPWLWDLCLCLSNAYPHVVPFEELDLPDELGRGQDDRVQALLTTIKPWTDAQYIVAAVKGLRIRLPHLHLPKTEEWEEVRENNFSRTVQALHSKEGRKRSGNPLFRFVFHRPLNQEQARLWILRLKELEVEFGAEPFDMSPGEIDEDPTHALAVLFGRRKLRR